MMDADSLLHFKYLRSAWLLWALRTMSSHATIAVSGLAAWVVIYSCFGSIISISFLVALCFSFLRNGGGLPAPLFWLTFPIMIFSSFVFYSILVLWLVVSGQFSLPVMLTGRGIERVVKVGDGGSYRIVLASGSALFIAPSAEEVGMFDMAVSESRRYVGWELGGLVGEVNGLV